MMTTLFHIAMEWWIFGSIAVFITMWYTMWPKQKKDTAEKRKELGIGYSIMVLCTSALVYLGISVVTGPVWPITMNVYISYYHECVKK